MENLPKLHFTINMPFVAFKLKVVCCATYFAFIRFFYCVLINCKQSALAYKTTNRTHKHRFCFQIKSFYFFALVLNHVDTIFLFHFIKKRRFPKINQKKVF